MTLIPSALLDKDPQPSLLLDANAVLRAANPAMLGELNGWPPQSLSLLLPANHAALVSACLGQQRAIAEVESLAGERILLWTFIPAGPSARRPRPGACTA